MTERAVVQKEKERGRELLLRGLPSVLFSRSTYQIEVYDDTIGNETAWVFLSLNQDSEIIDCFCECEAFSRAQSCPHVAAASLFIFQEGEEPLHHRYTSSLWYILFFIAARRHGFSPKIEESRAKKGGFSLTSSSGKEIFSLTVKTEDARKKLDEFVFHRQKETEENSIKFSGLDAEEWKAYKEGRPSKEFQFELSLWGDLSKWIFVLDREEMASQLTFSEIDKGGLPCQIDVDFGCLAFSLYLAKSNWEEILPFLKGYSSPFSVHEGFDFTIKEMHYDKEKGAITFVKEPFLFDAKDSYIDLGEWVFRKEWGFFPKETPPLFMKEMLQEEDLSLLFRSHLDLVKRKLKNSTIHIEKIEPKYSLSIDQKGNLHISLYVFKKGDLNHHRGSYFHPWAFVEEYGFVRLKKPLFEEAKKVIKKEKVGEFITEYRAWLGTFEGFETHLSRMEAPLTYEVLPDKSIHFFTASMEAEMKDSIDFGEWLYVRGGGFFSKNRGGVQSFLKSGMTIEKHDVSGFIRSHEPELELINGFFARHSPILKLGLNIRYNRASGMIEVEGDVDYTAGHDGHNTAIYSEYTYVKGEGFFRIPEKLLLPAGYEHPREIPPFLEHHFLFQELPELMPYVFDIDPCLVRAQKGILEIEEIAHDAKKGLWTLKARLTSELGKSSLLPIFHAVKGGKPFLPTSAGLLLLKETSFEWLKRAKDHHISEKGLTLSSIEWIALLAYQAVEFASTCDKEMEKALMQIASQDLQDFAMPSLAGFKTVLRPYQEMGVRWIYHLYQNHLSGILADEMGLGKTHQAMGLIAASRSHIGPGAGKYLVICPTSVVYHWENLLKEFLPDVVINVYYGIDRKMSGDFDILLTSYGTLRQDIEKLKTIPFEIAIFDEMQSAKNKESRIHRSLKVVNAKMKMGLTGTPIENDLSELKALFDILIPSLFPQDEVFKELFISPIERGEDKERYKVLRKLIHPFILRRKKSEVLKDLPEKIEEISYIDLSDEQREMYKNIFQVGFHALEEIEGQKGGHFHLHIFALLSKLKQVCDHPALITKEIDRYEEYTSGKFELFKELLEEARQSGQKVVVFTQYLDMLRIIKKYLDKENIQSAMIHGQIKDRKGEVERFKNDPSCEVFIASLGAGGVGIDLTQASVVIHYDRWWNPAKENQATDRVHRYGQTRGVQVFKFVSKNTIEEHIHAIIEKKQNLMQDVIGFDDQDHLKKMDPKELMQMMRRLY